jgi:Fe-S oxidoreductase
LDVPVLSQARQPVEVLWFVGDYAAYHPAACAATRAFARILQALGVRFGILGHEEVSDGDSQRMAGEIGLFEMLAEKNGRAFRKYAFQEIVTTDPHAYNALRHEYPKLGFAYPVRHYTQFLAERLDALRPMLTRPVQATTTFHDPCYLGRVNKVYEEPRALLEAIPGLQLVEMTHSRSMSLCCGGGGGGMWLDGYQWDVAHARTTGWRVQELVAARPLQDFLSVIGQNGSGKKRKALEPGPPSRRVLAVACPYEKPRFGDAIKVVGRPRDLQVLDLAELLTEAMGI